MDDVVQELDEDATDGMPSTICFWQEQLKRHQQQNMDVDDTTEQEQTGIQRRTRSPSLPNSNPPSNEPKSVGRNSDQDAESVTKLE